MSSPGSIMIWRIPDVLQIIYNLWNSQFYMPLLSKETCSSDQPERKLVDILVCQSLFFPL